MSLASVGKVLQQFEFLREISQKHSSTVRIPARNKHIQKHSSTVRIPARNKHIQIFENSKIHFCIVKNTVANLLREISRGNCFKM